MLLRLLLITTMLVLLWRFFWTPRSLPGVTRSQPWLIGHRGVRGPLPENTLPAFRMAFGAGLDGIECDVQITRDGVVVLFHDFEIEGQRLERLTYQELIALDPEIPRLEALLELSRDYPGTLLNLELKTDRFRTYGLEPEVARAVRRFELQDRVLVSSFNPVSLIKLRLAAPELRVGLLYAPDLPRFLRSGWLAPWLHVDALHPYEKQVTPALMSRAKRRGYLVNTWTVNDPKRVRSLLKLGVDGIIADDPQALREAAGPPD